MIALRIGEAAESDLFGTVLSLGWRGGVAREREREKMSSAGGEDQCVHCNRWYLERESGWRRGQLKSVKILDLIIHDDIMKTDSREGSGGEKLKSEEMLHNSDLC